MKKIYFLYVIAFLITSSNSMEKIDNPHLHIRTLTSLEYAELLKNRRDELYQDYRGKTYVSLDEVNNELYKQRKYFFNRLIQESWNQNELLLKRFQNDYLQTTRFFLCILAEQNNIMEAKNIFYQTYCFCKQWNNTTNQQNLKELISFYSELVEKITTRIKPIEITSPHPLRYGSGNFNESHEKIITTLNNLNLNN